MDAEKIAAGLASDTRWALNYHALPERTSSCGNMAVDMTLLMAGLLTFAPDSRLELTPPGFRVRAIINGD